jgi:hypothetical protein
MSGYANSFAAGCMNPVSWLCALVFVTFSCSDDGPTDVRSGGEDRVASVEVKPDSLTLAPGGSAGLEATLRTSDGDKLTGVTPVWTSSDTSIARVSDDGVVTAIGAGRASIGASAQGRTDSVVVTVAPQTAPPGVAGERARSADSFVNSIGVAVHLRYLDTSYARFHDVIKPRLRELGVRFIRDGGNDPAFFAKLNDLAALGIKSLLVMDPRAGIDVPAALSIAKSVPSSVNAVELMNEYDVSGNTAWDATLRTYAQQLHSALKGDPATTRLPIVGTAFVTWGATTRIGDLSAWVDYSNMHPLRYFPPGATRTNVPNGNIKSEIAFRSRPYAQKPMWASETSYPTCPGLGNGVSEAAQGKYTPRYLLEWFNQGVVRTFIYELIDQRDDPACRNSEMHMGILRSDGSPKPAFLAVKNLIALLADPGGADDQAGTLQFSLGGASPDVHHTLLQKRDGRFYLLLWQEVSSFGIFGTNRDIAVPPLPTTLNLTTRIRKATVYLPYEGPNPISQHSDPAQVSLNVPDHPLVIELVP